MPVQECIICCEAKVLFQVPPCGNVGLHRQICTECSARIIATTGNCPLCKTPYRPEISFYNYFMTCTKEELPAIIPDICHHEKCGLIEYAARENDLDIVNMILNHAPEYIVPFNSKYTPLHTLAAHCGHTELMKFLAEKLASHLNQEVTSIIGLQCLINAIHSENAACVQAALDLGAEPLGVSSTEETPMTAAAFRGNVDFLERYHPGRVSPTEFHYGCRGKHAMEVISFFMGKGVDIEGDHKLLNCACSLMFADVPNQLGWLKELIDQGSSLVGVLTMACAMQGKMETIQFLTDRGDINEIFNTMTPINSAVRRNDIPIVDFLLAKGANPNSAIHSASWKGNPSMVELLLSKGASRSLQDESGRTPLTVAHKDVLEMLQLPMVLAARAGDMEKLRELAVVEDVNDVSGTETPLHAAARNGNREMVEFLLQVGAEKGILTSEGKSTLEIAKENGHTDLLRLL